MIEKRKYGKWTNESNMNLDKKEIREYFYHTARTLLQTWRARKDKKDKRIKELEEALKYYADMNLYHMTAGGSYFIQEMPAGTRARKALEELNG